jgi:hypothetical protein
MNFQDDTSIGTTTGEPDLRNRLAAIGTRLSRSLGTVLQALPGAPLGPADLARATGIDKVLASRVLKAAKHPDPIAVLHHIPGPDPLRRLLRGALRRKVPSELVAAAENAIEEFGSLMRSEVGNRSALEAMISGWIPEVREEFELRRKQTAFRAVSELKGSLAAVNLATAILHPSDDGVHIDVVWIFGLLGLQRLRANAAVKFASRRFAGNEAPRLPQTLDGVPVEGLDGLRLDEFCSSPPAALNVHHVGEVVQYTLADQGFGLRAATDLVFAEVNLREMPRYVPADQKRKRHVFAEVGTPSRFLLFDTFLHQQLTTGHDPELILYDTTLEGVADINDPARDIDRLDLCETIQNLGLGIPRLRTAEVPRYEALLELVFRKLGWRAEEFRAYRCEIHYPPHGAQVAMAWDSMPPPSAA